MFRYRTDLWQPAIIDAPVSSALDPMRFAQARQVMLPAQKRFAFLADPFGIWRGDSLYVFAEAYNYRDKRGHIAGFEYDAQLNLLDTFEALRAPHHLSYPYLIEDGGELFMLPEAHRSGALTLYRAVNFPKRWEKVRDLLPVPAIDASVVKYDGRWWMFYALPDVPISALHVAYANALTGPWTPHPGNPVLTGSTRARPGGTPFTHDGAFYLPAQDCSSTYGGGITLNRVDTLTTDAFSASIATMLPPPQGWEGMHTLAACGRVTLTDYKRIDRSPLRALANVERRLRRMFA